MKFSSLKLRGMGSTFPKTAELDIDALKGPLVAICGDIGQGKSVALECLMGAIDRTTPTRGRLGDLATTRDAMVEVVVHNGQPYTIRQTMDSVSGKGESLIMTEDGQPVIKSGKRRDFDKWAAEHFPPANVRMASTFGAQKSEGFIDLKGAARKDVILSIKGCDHLQAMSTQAGDLAREMSREHDSNVERINMLRGGVSAVVIVSEIKDLERDIAASVERVDATTRKVGDARVAIATHKTRLDQHEERTRTRRDLDERVSTKRTELADIREMITNNEHIITEADAIRDAADRKPKLEGEHAALAESTATAQAELTAARDRRTEVRRQKQTQDERVSRTTDDIANAETKIGDWREKMAEAEKQLPIEEEADAAAAKEADEHDAEECRLAKLFLNSKDDRIKSLRDALEYIVTNDDADAMPPFEIAAGALSADDTDAKAAEEAPVKQADAGRAHRAALEKQLEHTRAARAHRQTKTDAETYIANSTANVDAWRKDRESARDRFCEAEAQLNTASIKIKDRSGVVAANATRMTEIVDTITTLAPLAKRAVPLDRAEARLEELRPQATKLETEIATARTALDVLGPPEAAPSAPQSINVLEVDLADANRGYQRDSEALSAARSRLERREKDDTDAAKLNERRVELEADIADWRLLQADLGRDGLQAHEVDAAGPELTELANDLLHSCYGSRFSVRIDTTHKSADGKRDIEDCLVNVIDTKQGHDGKVEEFSGGERGLIGEAIDLALTTVGTRTAGLESPTIVRDERGASQSAESERAYISMLRRAAERIGASHVLFVSHREETRALADSRVTIKGGQFHVQ